MAFDEIRREWTRERQEERIERENRERQTREEEAKKRASISWEGLEAGYCLRYGVKEYTSHLSRVPLGLDGIQECQKKPISIHGRDWFPSRCEESVSNSQIGCVIGTSSFEIRRAFVGALLHIGKLTLMNRPVSPGGSIIRIR